MTKTSPQIYDEICREFVRCNANPVTFCILTPREIAKLGDDESSKKELARVHVFMIYGVLLEQSGTFIKSFVSLESLLAGSLLADIRKNTKPFGLGIEDNTVRYVLAELAALGAVATKKNKKGTFYKPLIP